MIPCPKPVRVRDDGLRAFIRGLPCLLAFEEPCTCGAYLNVVTRRTPIEAAHVKSVGSGGGDPENLVPLCGAHHRGLRGQHQKGIATFEREHRDALEGRTLKQIARELDALYRAELPPAA